MANTIAVVALDDCAVFILDRLSLAVLPGVAHFLAVAALGNTSLNDLASILEAGKQLVTIHRPAILLTGTGRLIAEAKRDGVLLVKVALEVHVGVRWQQRPLHGNKEKIHVLFHQSLLEVPIGHCGAGLAVLSNSFLDIVKVSPTDSGLEIGPSAVGIDVGDMATIDDSGVLALGTAMTCACRRLASSIFMIFWTVLSLTYLPGRSCGRQ